MSHRGLFNTNHRLSLAARDTLTRADLGRLEAHLADKAQARGRQERHFGSTLGFRQEAGKSETRSHAQRPHTWLQARGRQEGRHTRQKRHTWMTKIGVSEKEENDHNPNSCGCAQSNLSGDSTFCIFSLYTDLQKSESVRRREVIQKAI